MRCFPRYTSDDPVSLLVVVRAREFDVQVALLMPYSRYRAGVGVSDPACIAIAGIRLTLYLDFFTQNLLMSYYE